MTFRPATGKATPARLYSAASSRRSYFRMLKPREVAAVEEPGQARGDGPEGGAVGHVVVGDPVDGGGLGRDRDAGVHPPGPVVEARRRARASGR